MVYMYVKFSRFLRLSICLKAMKLWDTCRLFAVVLYAMLKYGVGFAFHYTNMQNLLHAYKVKYYSAINNRKFPFAEM